MRILALVLLLTSVSFAQADVIETFNGSTQQERELRWIWKYLGDFVRGCAISKECSSAPEIKKVIGELAAYIPADYKPAPAPWANQLQFVSETAHPEIFQSAKSEIHRVAITELKRGAAVYINTDRMNLSLEQWVGLLTHETVHHLGYDDDSTRLPDRVGAAVSAFFSAHWVESNLNDFGHPELKLMIYNNPLPGEAGRSFYSMPLTTDDFDLRPNDRVPLCKEGDTFVGGQTVTSPLWRASRITAEKGLVSILGVGVMHSTCRAPNGQTSIVASTLVLMLDLVYKSRIDLSTAWWNEPSTINPLTMAGGVNDGAENLMDVNRTFIIKSITYPQVAIKPGGLWNAQVVVESIDGVPPKTCEIYFTGAQWSFNAWMNLPAVEAFDSCKITSLGNNQWQLDATTAIPSNAQSDLMYIPLIRFANDDGDRFAMPIKPQVEALINPNFVRPMHVVAYRILGLQPLLKVGPAAFINSYTVEPEIPFWLEVDLAGTQSVVEEFADLQLISSYGGSMYFRPFSSRIDHMQAVILKSEHVQIPGGLRLRYQMKIPKTVGVLPVDGFKLGRIYAKTSDFTYVELNIARLNEGFIMDQAAIADGSGANKAPRAK